MSGIPETLTIKDTDLVKEESRRFLTIEQISLEFNLWCESISGREWSPTTTIVSNLKCCGIQLQHVL